MDEFLTFVWRLFETFEWPRIIDDDLWATYRNSQKRSVAGIVASKLFMGCFEPAFILWTMADEKGIPVKFLQMTDVTSDPEEPVGHCFVELYDKENDCWIKTDPTQRTVLEQYSANYVLLGEGPFIWASFDEFEKAQKKFLLQAKK